MKEAVELLKKGRWFFKTFKIFDGPNKDIPDGTPVIPCSFEIAIGMLIVKTHNAVVDQVLQLLEEPEHTMKAAKIKVITLLEDAKAARDISIKGRDYIILNAEAYYKALALLAIVEKPICSTCNGSKEVERKNYIGFCGYNNCQGEFHKKDIVRKHWFKGGYTFRCPRCDRLMYKSTLIKWEMITCPDCKS